jgi:hypothetical protein
MEKKAITWKVIQLLHDLYTKKVCKYHDLSVYDSTHYIFTQTDWLQSNSKKEISTHPNKQVLFKNWYEDTQFDKTYSQIQEIVNKYALDNLLDDCTLQQLGGVLKIEQQAHELHPQNDLTLKEVSSRYFSDAKTVKEGSNLYKVICKLLGREDFAKGEQFMRVLHCTQGSPQYIVLCENENQLYKQRKPHIEIWVAGGYNLPKLDFLPQPTCPIFYLGDFDQDGMDIFLKAQQYLPQIQLLVPQNYQQLAKSISQTQHRSTWKQNFPFHLFSAKAQEVLQFLVQSQQWIEEESMNLETCIQHYFT